MAFKRKYKKRVYRKKKSGMTLKKLAKIVRQRAPEIKYYDGFSSISSADVTLVSNTPTNLFLVAQGDDNAQREGLKVRFKDIDFRMELKVPTTTNTTQRLRIIVFKAKRPNLVLVPQSDLLANGTIDAFNEDKFKKDYQILFDREVHWEVTATRIDTQKWIDWKRKLDWPVTYTSSANNSDAYGGIGLFVLSNQSVANDRVRYQVKTRIRYTDV